LRLVTSAGTTGSSLIRLGVLAVALLCLVAFPFVSGQYYVTLLTLILIAGIYAMGLDLVFGYAGLHSLGHAAFVGTGAYTIAIVSKRLLPNFYVNLLAALVASAVLAAIFGILAVRARGSYFLMITLALGQVMWAVTWGWRAVTGGDDGFPGIKRPDLGIPVSMADPVLFYFLVLVFFLVTAIVLYRIVKSPFGLALIGIRENETRMSILGYNVWLYKLLAFVVSGTFGGLGGALLAYSRGTALPSFLHFEFSAEVFLMVVVGGTGTLIGPVLGAVLVMLIKYIVGAYTERWVMVMGLVYVIVALSNSGGLVFAFNDLWSRFRKPGTDDGKLVGRERQQGL